MFEKSLTGGKGYWTWIIFLLAVAGIGTITYLQQYKVGLGITGLSRDVSWGLYIGQFTFLVGVAASAVMLIIPYYLHDYKKYGKIVILGEFLAVSSVIMCILFIFVDMGQPTRIMNVILHPTPSSIMFWDSVVLVSYLMLNIIIGWTTLHADKKAVKPPSWIKPLIYLSIPLAISIHTVTAFLYAGLPGRYFWMSALTAAHFLASAFAAGPALLIILALLVRRFTKFDPGIEPIQALAKTVTYAMIVNVFFIGLKIFSSSYSQIPGYTYPLQYLYFGLDGYNKLVPVMWVSNILAIISICLLIVPALRKNEKFLALACVSLFASLWIDKGFGFIIGGYVPNPFKRVTEYWPTVPETLISAGVWAIGLLVLTVLYKIAVTVREETAGMELEH
jgi:molybdopterin-containing oxidoreductase family membrane subunit